MKLRVRHAAGQSMLTLPDDAKVEQLTTKVCEIIGKVDIDRLELKSGYPPKVVPLRPGHATLSSLGIKHGEQVIVQLSDTGDVVAADHEAQFEVYRHSLAPALPPGRSQLNGQQRDQEIIKVSEGAYLRLREQPDDNSCLFSSIKTLLRPLASVQDIREIVATAIHKDPSNYTEAYLGRPRADYIQNIRKKEAWGGAIELAILSAELKTQIWSVDVLTGRIDQYGQGHDDFSDRCFVLYSGIHYDAIVISPSRDSTADTTILPALPDNAEALGITDPIREAAIKLAGYLKARHYYTDTATFSLKCGVCAAPLKGEKAARAHAESTGHGNFVEYS